MAKKMRVGETRIVKRVVTRVKGGVKKRRDGKGLKVKEKRLCYVTKKAGGTYRVRLVNPKTNAAGKKYNYGQGWTSDQNHLNHNEKWESSYNSSFGRRGKWW